MNRLWVALGTVYLVWGSTYLAIRWSVETMPALLSAAFRFLAAGVILGAVALARRRRWVGLVTPQQLVWAALCGVLLLVGGNGLVVLAETHIPSGLAALLVAAVPLWLVVLRRFAGERTSGLSLIGVLVGFGGVMLLLVPGLRGDVDLAHSALVVLAALSWSIGSLLGTRRPVPGDPVVLSATEMVAGGVVLLGLASVKGEWSGLDLAAISTKSWLSLGYLVVFGSIVAFSAYLWALGHGPTSLVATYAYVNPAVAVLLGVALADEKLTGFVIAGGAVIIAAVALVVRAESRPPKEVAPPDEAELVHR
jgi:drug/metabolite transporter (DMT)-like permease